MLLFLCPSASIPLPANPFVSLSNASAFAQSAADVAAGPVSNQLQQPTVTIVAVSIASANAAAEWEPGDEAQRILEPEERREWEAKYKNKT